jgi:transcriptional regulator with XRE-family HTH domain
MSNDVTKSSVPPLARTDVRENLGDLRRRAGLNQAALAELADLSQPYITLLETNRRPMSDELADKLIAVLEVAIESREESRRKIKELVSRLFPWSEDDERLLQRERNKREKALNPEGGPTR